MGPPLWPGVGVEPFWSSSGGPRKLSNMPSAGCLVAPLLPVSVCATTPRLAMQQCVTSVL